MSSFAPVLENLRSVLRRICGERSGVCLCGIDQGRNPPFPPIRLRNCPLYFAEYQCSVLRG